MSAPAGDTTFTPPRIDPRLRERRVAVRRDEGRRRLRLLIGAVAVVVAAIGGWALTRSPLLDVDHIVVRGVGRTQPADVAASSRLHRGEAMTGVDEGRAAGRIRRLPWVGRVSVRRRWPGTVVIDVVERRPAASVRGAGAGWLLVDRRGRVLARAALPAERLPAIEGTRRAGAPGTRVDTDADAALRVAAHIAPARVSQVRVVARLADGTIELRLVGRGDVAGGVVRFGRPDEVAAKLVATFAVLDRVGVDAVSVLDVRVPAAPVLVRRANAA